MRKTVLIFSIILISLSACNTAKYLAEKPQDNYPVVKPPKPNEHYAWVSPSYRWDPVLKTWMYRPGKWVKIPKGKVWVEGEWVKKKHGWIWKRGYWKKAGAKPKKHGKE
jgi:hypothetical protein